MDLIDFNRNRKELMELLRTNDPFFGDFGKLDDRAFDEGHIPKKYKELCMITTSIAVHCEECALYHAEEAIHAGATLAEMKEAIIMGLMSGGSLCYPPARNTLAKVMELFKAPE